MSSVLGSASGHSSVSGVPQGSHGGSSLGKGTVGISKHSQIKEEETSQAMKNLLAFNTRILPTSKAMKKSPVIQDTAITAKRIAAIIRRIKQLLGQDFSIVPNQALFTTILPETHPHSLAFNSFFNAIFACPPPHPQATEQSYSATIGILGENNMVTVYGLRDWFKSKAMYLLTIQAIQSTIDTLVEINDKGIAQMNTNAIIYKNQVLSRQNCTDTLTGISNRRAMDYKIQELKTLNTPVHCMMFDIDHFKRVNDTHGHGVGDIILEDVSMLLAKEFENYFGFKPSERLYEIPGNHRECIVVRMGGEEFCCLISGIDEETARKFAEHIRKTIEGYQFIFPIQGPPPSIGGLDITISVGVAHVPDASKMSESSLLEYADAALYRAKHAGRNQVAVYDPHAKPIITTDTIIHSHGDTERRGLRA